jgi:hypothetical protein
MGHVKNTILQAAEEALGKKKKKYKKKGITIWNEEITEVIKVKKRLI